MADDYSNYPDQVTISSGSRYVAITPADTDLANGVCRGIYLGASGNLTVLDLAGNTVQFIAPSTGVIHPIQAKQIKAATTATSVVAVY